MLVVALSPAVGTARPGANRVPDPGVRTTGAGYHESLCQARPFMCLDKYKSIGANGEYTGHDEPTAQFISKRPGSGGADLSYDITLPKNAKVTPKQDGTGGTYDFQRRATFWFSITMCDTESAPNFTKTCNANDDANARFRSADPSSAHYLGKSPGNAFMELQFYTPGWIPQFDGFGCSARKWCANLTIDSLSDDQNTGVPQNADCLNNHFLVGEEPINWAYITKDGGSQAPANPLALSDDPTFAGLNPDLDRDLLMNPGDRLRLHMHDTPAGYRIDITDRTTGEHGSMTASIANGFGHILYEPDATECHVAPYAFHPMYDTAVARGTTWGAHTTNVGFSDEIGHFEYCDAINAAAQCTDPGGADTEVDVDDQVCLDGADFDALIPLKGCLLDDGDFDGVSYQRDWPGTLKKAGPGPQAARHTGPAHGAEHRRTHAGTGGVRDRPAPHRARRAGQPQPPVRRPHRCELRQPAARRSVLPDLHLHQAARGLLPAAGWTAVETHAEHVRRHFGHRVRHRRAVRDLSQRRVPADHAGGGLQTRARSEPVLVA